MADNYDHHMDPGEALQLHLGWLDRIEQAAWRICDNDEDTGRVLEAARVLMQIMDRRACLLRLYRRRLEVLPSMDEIDEEIGRIEAEFREEDW